MSDVNGVTGSNLNEVFSEALTDVPRRRGRWILPLIVVLILLAAAFGVTELICRMLVGKAVEAAMTQAGVEAGGTVNVSIDGLLLPQLLTGSIDRMTVAADRASVRGIDADVSITLHDVGIFSREADSIEMVADADAESVRSLVEAAGGSALDRFGGAPHVSFEEPLMELSGETSVHDIPFSIVATVLPSAEDGELVLSLDDITVELAGDEGELAQALGLPSGVSLDDAPPGVLPPAPSFPDAPVRVCLAGTLPNGVQLVDAAVIGDRLEIDFDIDGKIVTTPSLRATGSCA